MSIFERLSVVFVFLMGLIVYSHASKAEIETFREIRYFTSYEKCVKWAETPDNLDYFIRFDGENHTTWYGSSTTMGSHADIRIRNCSEGEAIRGEMRLISYYIPEPKKE